MDIGAPGGATRRLGDERPLMVIPIEPNASAIEALADPSG